jgi:hypothetical protein
MSNNGGSGDLTPEQMQLICIGFLAIAMGLVPFGALLDPVRDWLLASHVMVPSAQALLEIPGTGIGLDLPRLIILAAVAIGIIAGAVLIVRRKSVDD